MTEPKLPHNEDCEQDNHHQHLCYLMYEGFHYSHPEEYKGMVQDAHFRCRNCGRTACEASMLCDPVSL
jgi:hypothetical protein